MVRRLLEHLHLVIISKVAQKSHEQPDVGDLVEQILVLQLLRRRVADSLKELASTGAVSAHEAIVDHLAVLTLEILQLVSHDSAVEEVDQSLLNRELVEVCFTVLALPVSDEAFSLIIVNLLVDILVSADVEVLRLLANLADDIGYH